MTISKNVSVITLSAAAAALMTFTGCGGGSSSSGTGSSSSEVSSSSSSSVDGTLVKTAYDYFVKDAKVAIAAGGSLNYNDQTTAAGVDEATVWKGQAGSMDPLEDPATTSGYSVNCTPGSITDTLPAVIDSNMSLTNDKVYGYNGKVNVKPGVVVTVQAGTKIVGETPNSYVVFEPGSQLMAKGTMDQPIVFTSQKDLECKSGDNKAGEWGGLVLAGNAYTHYGVGKYEADESVEFGCDESKGIACINDQSSGDLEYVLVKHTGYEVEKDKELNGLSLAGVGSGTVLKNIAIIGGLDDGTEIWGGRVNYDGLYVYNAADDSVDTDLGYRGTIKNVLVRQVNVDKTNNHDSSGMEFGNDANTITTDDSNCTQPTMINYTGYIKGGGFYNKYDAGVKWNNVKFISDKAVDYEMVHFRGADSYDTGGKHIEGPVSFYDSAIELDENKTYSHKNSKAQ